MLLIWHVPGPQTEAHIAAITKPLSRALPARQRHARRQRQLCRLFEGPAFCRLQGLCRVQYHLLSDDPAMARIANIYRHHRNFGRTCAVGQCAGPVFIFEPEGAAPASNVIGALRARADREPETVLSFQLNTLLRRMRLRISTLSQKVKVSLTLRCACHARADGAPIDVPAYHASDHQAAAQAKPIEAAVTRPPQHAIPFATGGGWTCKPGFRKLGEGCASINLPDNAYLTNSTYGSGWECRRGYLPKDDVCVAMIVPPHAFLTSSGSSGGWQCERGYYKDGQQCTAVVLPANAFLTEDTSYGRGWDCERGFRHLAGALRCHPGSSQCLPGRERLWSGLDLRARIQADRRHLHGGRSPANGYLDAAGSGFKCDRRFARSGQDCVAVIVPERGFLQASGGGWDCEPPFRKRDEKCVAP